MRKHTWSLYAVAMAFLLAASSCEKEGPVNPISPTPPAPTPIPPPAPSVNNTSPIVFAIQDIWIVIPVSSVTLKGSVLDAENNISTYLWSQVSGPSAALIEKPDSLETKVAKLEKGTYVFQLTVKDTGGLTGKNTVTVFVREPAVPGHGEVIVKDLEWSCPWGCSLLINCFTCLVPAQPFKVYLRRDGSNDWEEVIPEANWTSNVKYVYSLSNNQLWIYSDTEYGDTPDVKITY